MTRPLDRKEKALLFAALALLLLSVCIHSISVGSSDKSWLLVAARMWLSGKRLYTDIFEVNPPLIVWIYAVPVWLAEHLPLLQDYNALALLGLAVTAFVIRLSTQFIARHPAFADHPKRRLAFALLLALVLVFLTNPKFFFDREHILLVLTLPYVLRFCPALARQPLPLSRRILIGVLAGVGFCIKPHTAVLFAVLQLLFLLRERSAAMLLSVENRLIYLLSAAYVAFVIFCMPEYLHTVMPMMLATYSAFSGKVNGIYSIILLIILLGVTFADFRPRFNSPFRKEVYYFLGVTAGWLAYALVNNGWSYTYNPAISMARFLSGWVLMEFLWLKADARAHGLPEKPFIFGIRSCGFVFAANIAFFLLCYGLYLLPGDCVKSTQCSSNASLITQAQRYHTISFGTMSMEFPKWAEFARESGARWETRFNHLWMLPAFILSGPEFAQKNQWIITYVGEAYADDMQRRKPEVMFIDSSPQVFMHHPHVDLPGLFRDVPAFGPAWSRYRLQGVIDTCGPTVTVDCRYDVYRRIPGS